MAHLGGFTGMKRFLETGGMYDPHDGKDGNVGTRLSEYARRGAASEGVNGGTVSTRGSSNAGAPTTANAVAQSIAADTSQAPSAAPASPGSTAGGFGSSAAVDAFLEMVQQPGSTFPPEQVATIVASLQGTQAGINSAAEARATEQFNLNVDQQVSDMLPSLNVADPLGDLQRRIQGMGLNQVQQQAYMGRATAILEQNQGMFQGGTSAITLQTLSDEGMFEGLEDGAINNALPSAFADNYASLTSATESMPLYIKPVGDMNQAGAESGDLTAPSGGGAGAGGATDFQAYLSELNSTFNTGDETNSIINTDGFAAQLQQYKRDKGGNITEEQIIKAARNSLTNDANYNERLALDVEAMDAELSYLLSTEGSNKGRYDANKFERSRQIERESTQRQDEANKEKLNYESAEAAMNILLNRTGGKTTDQNRTEVQKYAAQMITAGNNLQKLTDQARTAAGVETSGERAQREAGEEAERRSLVDEQMSRAVSQAQPETARLSSEEQIANQTLDGTRSFLNNALGKVAGLGAITGGAVLGAAGSVASAVGATDVGTALTRRDNILTNRAETMFKDGAKASYSRSDSAFDTPRQSFDPASLPPVEAKKVINQIEEMEAAGIDVPPMLREMADALRQRLDIRSNTNRSRASQLLNQAGR
jgi:hypothetical protein